jgi:hypothetical protein
VNAPAFPPVVRLASEDFRARLHRIIDALPIGWVVRFSPPTRSLEQSARFHAMLGDIVRSGFEHEGRRFDAEDLKTMFVSAWLIETGRRSDVVKGFAGEPVQLRRSTTTFTKQEMGELIDLVEAFAGERGITLRGGQ